MDEFVIPVPLAPVEKHTALRLRRHHWSQAAFEVEGRIPSWYRRRATHLHLDSFSQVGAFGHDYRIGDQNCRTHLARMENAGLSSEGISALDFDTKGIYLASVTRSGCLTVHDFEALYNTVYDPNYGSLEDQAKLVLHVKNPVALNAVRWNPNNQDEVACVSNHCDKVSIFDIGYISSEPVEYLDKGVSKFSHWKIQSCCGLSDIMFTSADKTRVFASALDGVIYVWDRRSSYLPCLELGMGFHNRLNSMELDLEERIVFGANIQGDIHAWDLRGGRSSFAFQSHNKVDHNLLISLKVSSLLEKIASLKAQSNIVSKEIHSIAFDPSCSNQLAFHLADGWSGVLNICDLNVTHVHCPPPAWLDGMPACTSLISRRPAWFPTNSIFAVGSSFGKGLYLLDFFPRTSSVCHVDFNEDSQVLDKSSGVIRNKFISTTEDILVCAVHPLNGTIVAGSKQCSLVMISQKRQTRDGSDCCTSRL